ncbi:hypothetical protein Agub_g1621, partial [Astrephomene gubernaculifera]
MPPYSNLQHLKLQYREFLRKTAAYHRSESGDACTQNYYVERACVEATFEHSFARLRQIATTVSVSELRAYYQARKERAKARLRRAIDAKVSRFGTYLDNVRTSTTQLAASSDGSVQNQSTSSSLEQASEGASSSRTVVTASTGSSGQELQQLYGADGFLRRAVLYLVGSAARVYMTGLNSTSVEGLDHMSAALQRPAGQALITVSNHVAALDDPLVVTTLLPEGTLEQPDKLRWTLCASDRCFRYAAFVPFFRAAKVLPVVRGGGMTQPGMAAAEARLAAGDWVHIFPEGTRSPDGVKLGAVRKGVGRLVASVPEGSPPPLVLPFVHRGMEGVMPRGAVLPATGQQVDVLVGKPIPVGDLLAAARQEGWSEDRLHTAVAARVAHRLQHLAARLDARRAGLPDPGPEEEPPAPAGVSSLDQFDPADLLLAERLRQQRRRSGGAMAAAWERLKFRQGLQHRSWAMQEVSAPQAPAVAAVGGGG